MRLFFSSFALLADDDCTLRTPLSTGEPMRPEPVILAGGAGIADLNMPDTGTAEDQGIDLL